VQQREQAKTPPPRLTDIVAAHHESGEVPTKRDDVAQISERLSERQMDVLRLIAKGQSNKEIALALDLAPSTVKPS
jgi:two-component system, NarL family, nitrate/nitrite response regulator NarL